METGTSRNMRSITLRRTTGEAFSIKATEGHPFYTKAVSHDRGKTKLFRWNSRHGYESKLAHQVLDRRF